LDPGGNGELSKRKDARDCLEKEKMFIVCERIIVKIMRIKFGRCRSIHNRKMCSMVFSSNRQSLNWLLVVRGKEVILGDMIDEDEVNFKIDPVIPKRIGEMIWMHILGYQFHIVQLKEKRNKK
jgi:hypothetical protein